MKTEKLFSVMAAPHSRGGLVHAPPPREAQKKYATYGVAFTTWKIFFDTINNNGRYDLEFSPKRFPQMGQQEILEQDQESVVRNLADDH